MNPGIRSFENSGSLRLCKYDVIIFVHNVCKIVQECTYINNNKLSHGD